MATMCTSVVFQGCKLLKTCSNNCLVMSVIHLRSLYSASALGLDKFQLTRDKTKQQFLQINNKFKEKMKDFTSDGSKSMVFTEDLKNMIYLIEDSDEDISLVEKMILKFNQQNKELRFGSFVFGPVVMRMYYILNKPFEALKLFKNPELDGFFDQVMSYQILMDLLYNNNLYDEVIEVFDIIKNRQLMSQKFHRNPTVLAFAACYKKNNSDSFEYVKKIWKDMQSVGHRPVLKATTFAAGLAINQNSPHVAVELLSSVENQNYVTVRNLKICALADLDRPEDAFPILRRVLEYDGPIERKQTFSEEAIEKLRISIQRSGNKDLETEFNRIDQQLTIQGHISPEPISTKLCSEINFELRTRYNEDKRLAASFGINQPNRRQQHFVRREGLNDIR